MTNFDNGNYDIFRDCLFAAVAGNSDTGRQRVSKQRGRKGAASGLQHGTHVAYMTKEGDTSELADFVDYLATETFTNLPQDLRDLSYQALQTDASLAERWSLPLTLALLEEVTSYIPLSVADSLTAYGLIAPPDTDLQSFMSGILASYLATVTMPPPKWIETKASACEICDRDWVPLTYHHLIPKQVHAKVLKRGWHEEQQLNSVAWLCRACHSFVHRMALNEELAREWYTVDRILEREDVQKWAQWVRRVRWKKT